MTEFTEIASPAVRQALETACSPNRLLGYHQFVEIALYHPELGYYRSARERVGRKRTTDFFTASSLKAAFGPILVEASVALIESAGMNPSRVTWVEIGSEPGAALLDGLDSPFQSTETVQAGQPIELEGDRIVFSNELFDAQPFHRVVFRDGTWRERMIEVNDSGLREVEVPVTSPAIPPLLSRLPDPAPEGYSVDLPTGAKDLMETIASQPWRGAFIAFDYGKTWPALTHDTPQGTARAYYRHQQQTDLLERIGEQDLTCHICWDWLESVLIDHGFGTLALESQESFVLKRAPQFVADAFGAKAGLDTPEKGALRQLIHPTLMGQKFQALSGVRKEVPSALG